MDALNLRQNAFHLLGVSPTSSMSEIGEAYEDASFEERAPAKVLSEAQKSISVPVRRLGPELSCVPELGPDRFDAFMTALENGKAQAREFVRALRSPLSKANVAAHACSVSTLDASAPDTTLGRWALELLIESWAGIDPDETERMINKARSTGRSTGGGVPNAAKERVLDGLKNLQAAHRRVALSVISTAPHPGKVMTVVMEEHRHRKSPASDFVRDLVRDYDGWSIPRLRKIEKKIDAAIDRLSHDLSDRSSVDKIVLQLAKWDEYSQPVQLLNQSMGLDESRSKALFEKIRACAIKLANEDDRHDLSLILVQAMLHTFPELPDASSLLSKDVAALNRTVKFQDLLDLIKNLHTSPHKYAATLIQDTDSGRRSEIKALLNDVFSDPSVAEHEKIWWMVRATAIRLHNEHQLSHESLELLRALYECAHTHGAPKEIQTRLTQDMETISEICADIPLSPYEDITSSTASTQENKAAARRRVTGVSGDPANESSNSDTESFLGKLWFWGLVLFALYYWWTR